MTQLVSCASTEDPVVAPTASAASPTSDASEPQPASAASLPVRPAPASTPAIDRGAPQAADAPSFVVVAKSTGDGHVALLPSTSGELFAAVGPVLIRLASDGTVEVDPRWTRGLEPEADPDAYASGYSWWRAVALGGTWPEGAYFVLSPESGGRGDVTPNALYRRTNGKWSRVDTRGRRFDWYPRSFGAWKDGSLLALRAFDPRYSNYDEDGSGPPREVAAAAAAIAREKRLIVLRGAPKAPAFGHADVQAFASLPSGEIYAAIAEPAERGASKKGEEGEEPPRTVRMLHYDDLTEAQRTVALPGPGAPSPYELEVVATGDDRVWVFGYSEAETGDRAYVAHYDGRAWNRVTTPCHGRAWSGSIDDVGDAYFLCDLGPEPTTTTLMRVRRGIVEWLPTPISPELAVARRADDIWLATGPFAGDVQLAHSGAPPGDVVALPTNVEAAEIVFEWADPEPLGRKCDARWIPLVEGADRAAAASAVDGLSERGVYAEVIEARVQGKVELGVSVHPGSDAAAGKRIVEALGGNAGAPTCNHRPARASE